ncbi:release factor glutamine methyltransferase [Arthrobacter sp. Hiyo8]|nr:release factor glutamine methyltransferase [Arthrobacter sp. Hiyo8]
MDPGVFVPRRRTEYLVQAAARLARPGAVVVDLCCGSGAVGAALLAAAGGIELHAADVDPLRSAAPAVTSARWAARCTKAISIRRCRMLFAAGLTS